MLEISSSGIRYEAGTIGVITLDRPGKRNAIDDAMRAGLRDAIENAAASSDLRALVLTGSGVAFCAGGDVRGMEKRLEEGDRAPELGWRRQRSLHWTLELFHDLPVPTIAAVNGAAMGLGLDLALTCDFIVAAKSATFAESFVHRGLVPDGGSMYHLPRRVGLAKAKDLVFSGRRVDAEEALAIGLVDRLAEDGSALEDALAWAAEFAARPATAIGVAKEILNVTFESGLEEVDRLGAQAQAICYSTPDHRESVRAFLASRRSR
ncbi:enoyl-CoA hydratase/isomerase family protein [Amycolatopsis acidicola]|uniref:Enoyl-CoA hydratase/isomerase family protein n=1 Tax=Amycolatopsis acidicola TaxID=2596893 RepID=A0A5N0VGP3_9PSEU|nr:enoyl-CoA hydratase/isomerase family protein [Amycolatopsis acidicola]KAA9164001.1 enoyl-CoA hydratase/isomerase family protein [Amycolatopsis acidicola]